MTKKATKTKRKGNQANAASISPSGVSLVPVGNDKPTLNKKQLQELEATVRRGLDSFVEVGQALMEIREGKGYRLRGFDTFDEYCQKVFKFTDRHGRRMIASAKTAQATQKLLGEKPGNEAVARELAPVAEDPQALEQVQKKLGKKKLTVGTATAEEVKDAVQTVTASRKASEGPHGKNGKASTDKSPAAPRLPVMTDICPGCKETPQSYLHSENEKQPWACGNCGAPVLIGVIAADVQACSNCNAALIGEVEFCPECGEAV